MRLVAWWVVIGAAAGAAATFAAGAFGGPGGRTAMAAAGGLVAGPLALLFALGQAGAEGGPVTGSGSPPHRQSRTEQFLSDVFVYGGLLLAVAAVGVGIWVGVRLADREPFPWWLWVLGGLGGGCLGGLLGLIAGWGAERIGRRPPVG